MKALGGLWGLQTPNFHGPSHLMDQIMVHEVFVGSATSDSLLGELEMGKLTVQLAKAN